MSGHSLRRESATRLPREVGTGGPQDLATHLAVPSPILTLARNGVRRSILGLLPTGRLAFSERHPGVRYHVPTMRSGRCEIDPPLRSIYRSHWVDHSDS